MVTTRKSHSSALASAEIAKLNAEAAFFTQQAREKAAIADKAEHELAIARRMHDRAMRDNDEHRILDFTDSVTRSSAESAMKILSRWRRENLQPIVIRLSSPGGSVIDGFALYDYIQSVRRDGIHVTTCTLGMAASMACILLQAGDVRIMGENSHILIHEVAAGTIGKLSEMEDETAFCRRLNERLVAILAARAKMSKAKIVAKSKRKDWWLAPEEALKHGFVDKVGYA